MLLEYHFLGNIIYCPSCVYDFKEIGADVDEVSDLVSTLRLSPAPKFTLALLSLVAAMPPMTNAGVHQMINRAICEFSHF